MALVPGGHYKWIYLNPPCSWQPPSAPHEATLTPPTFAWLALHTQGYMGKHQRERSLCLLGRAPVGRCLSVLHSSRAAKLNHSVVKTVPTSQLGQVRAPGGGAVAVTSAQPPILSYPPSPALQPGSGLLCTAPHDRACHWHHRETVCAWASLTQQRPITGCSAS